MFNKFKANFEGTDLDLSLDITKSKRETPLKSKESLIATRSMLSSKKIYSNFEENIDFHSDEEESKNDSKV